MEMKEERVDGREVREFYTMLMDSDAIIRNHRTLRREICISRIVIFILLITCMAFCVILYTQQVHGSKNKENTNKEKANETVTEYQTGNAGNLDVQTPLLASLTIKHPPTSAKANLTWGPYLSLLNDFGLIESESLVIPQDGKYRLSLQITYVAPKGEGQNGSQVNLAHKIVRYSESYPGMPVPILSVYETVYWKRSWLKSVFSEVYYVFTKGDVVKVESENAKMIDIVGEVWTKNLLTIQFIPNYRLREL